MYFERGEDQCVLIDRETTLGVCEFVRIDDELDATSACFHSTLFRFNNASVLSLRCNRIAHRETSTLVYYYGSSLVVETPKTGKIWNEFPDDHSKSHEGIEDVRLVSLPNFAVLLNDKSCTETYFEVPKSSLYFLRQESGIL